MFDWFSFSFLFICGAFAVVDYLLTGGEYTVAILSWVALQVERVIDLMT